MVAVVDRIAVMPRKKPRKTTDRHTVPALTLRLPPPHAWFLRLLASHQERTVATVVVRAMRPELEALGLWPLPPDVKKELDGREFQNLDEFKSFLHQHRLWPPAADKEEGRP